MTKHGQRITSDTASNNRDVKYIFYGFNDLNRIKDMRIDKSVYNAKIKSKRSKSEQWESGKTKEAHVSQNLQYRFHSRWKKNMARNVKYVPDLSLFSNGVQEQGCDSRKQKFVKHAVKWKMFARHVC